MTSDGERRKLGAREIATSKGKRPLTMIAAYDYPIARIAERAGIDIILVGDSLGMTVLGYDSPVPVTVEEVLHHCRAVARGAPNTHVVADLPFLSYHLSDEQAILNSARMIQEGHADSVKLEGGAGVIAARIRVLVNAGIPVMGHIGLTPQTGGTGGYGIQGGDVDSAMAVIADAEAVAAAGAHSLVLEAAPRELAGIVREAVAIPVIGIGAGADCDGQTVVSTDVLGIETRLFLNFSKRFAELGTEIEAAFRAYVAESDSGAYPDDSLSTAMDPDVLSEVRRRLGS